MERTKRTETVRAVPEGFHTVTPFLIADNAAGLIGFIKSAFNGEQTFLMNDDSGKIMHATVKIGDSIIMLSDTMEGTPPQTAMLYLYIDDVDSLYQQALEAKATSVCEPRNEFYGDRAAAVKDAWGNVWWMAKHVEDVGQKELEERAEKMKREHKSGAEVHA